MSYKVLLVDDEEIVCDGLTKFVNWQELGYKVVSAANSVAQALVYMESNPVDVVISDIKMPIQSGLQLLEVIHEEYPDVNTIILSGYGEFEYAQKAMRLGAVDFLTKPVNFGELKKLLSTISRKIEADQSKIHNRLEYKQMQINNVLNSLAKGYISDLDHERAQQLQLPLSNGCGLYLIRIQMNGRYPQYEELSAAKEEVFQVAVRAAEGKGNVYVFNNELKETACVYVPEAELPGIQLFAVELSRMLDQCQIEAVIGISGKHDQLTQLKAAYMEAGKTLQYSIINHNQKITLYNEMNPALYMEHKIDEKLGMDMLNMLTDPDRRGDLVSLIHSTIDAMVHSGRQSIGEVQAFCVQTMLMLNRHFQSLSSDRSDFDSRLDHSIRILLLTPHATSAKDNMTSYLVQLIDEMTRLENSADSGNMIAKVKCYINEHFAEDISLGSLSNVFYVHPIYLSRLFKEKTGVNFIDYVTEVRINQSKELLRNQALKIYDISEMVGYESPRYFSKLFKNITGMTPREYKDSGRAPRPE